jgi:serine/threonine protein kinase
LVALLEDEGLRLVTLRSVVTFDEMRAYKGKLFQDANYVAPEQLGGEHDPGPTTPCYQLAALLFHMLAGQPPHGQGMPREIAKKHFQLPFPSLKRLQPFLSKGIYDVIAACTVKDPEERPTLEELVDALEAMTEGKPPGIEPPGGAGPRIATPRPRRRRRRR